MKIKVNKKIFTLSIGLFLIISAYFLFIEGKPKTPKDLIHKIITEGRKGNEIILNYLCKDSRDTLIANFAFKGNDDYFNQINANLYVLSKTNNELGLDNADNLDKIKKELQLDSYLKEDIEKELDKLRLESTKNGLIYNKITDSFSMSEEMTKKSKISKIPEINHNFINKAINYVYKGNKVALKKEYIKLISESINETETKIVDIKLIDIIDKNKYPVAKISPKFESDFNVGELYVFNIKGDLCIGTTSEDISKYGKNTYIPDSQRISELKNIEGKLQSYYMDEMHYPSIEDFTKVIGKQFQDPLDSKIINGCKFGYNYGVGDTNGINLSGYRLSTCLLESNIDAINDGGKDKKKYEIGEVNGDFKDYLISEIN